MTEIPLSLNQVGKEVLLALRAESDEDERIHRALADQLMSEAMRDMESAPGRAYDWSLLAAAG